MILVHADETTTKMFKTKSEKFPLFRKKYSLFVQLITVCNPPIRTRQPKGKIKGGNSILLNGMACHNFVRLK